MRALSPGGNPEFATVLKVVRALGLKLHAERGLIMEPIRISAQDTYKKVKAGEAFLVCGYEDDTKFKAFRIEMGLPFSEFLKKIPTLSKDQEIIFYCA